MEGFRWLRVMLDRQLFSAIAQEKARRAVTWDKLVEEALRLWLKSPESAERA